MDKLTAAIQEVAEDYGYKRLAAAVGCPYQVLVNQCNPINDRPISLRKFWLMFSITKDMRLLVAFLDEIGAVAVAKGKRNEDASLFDLVVNHQIAGGHVASTIRDALSDGEVTPDEFRSVRRAVREEIDALTALEDEMQDMAEPKLAKA